MAAGLRVAGRMVVGRAVATKRRPARLTGPQMDPLGTDLHTLLTFSALWLLDCFNSRNMQTGFFHFPPPYSCRLT